MNGKSILKHTLPIIIVLIVIITIAISSAAITGDKKVPTFSDSDMSEEAYLTYTDGDVKIVVTNGEVYSTLKSASGVPELVNIIDQDLLAEEVKNVDSEDVKETVVNAIFSSTLQVYVDGQDMELNAKIQAADEGVVFDDDYLDSFVQDAFDEKLDTFKTRMLVGNGVEIEDGDITMEVVRGQGITNEDGEAIDYQCVVKEDSAVYNNYILTVARTNYARVELEKEYNEAVTEYAQYLSDLESYNEYTADMATYKTDLADWKDAAKADRGDKPTKPDKDDYTCTKAPEKVKAPVLLESDFESAYEADKNDEYWSLIIPYSTKTAATNALLQYNVVIAINAKGYYDWFHYGVDNLEGVDAEAAQAIADAEYSTNGHIITDNDYYKTLSVDGTVDATTGAYELSENQIKQIMVKLYNDVYQASDDKGLVLDTDYSIADDGSVSFVYDKNAEDREDGQLYYTSSDLSALSLLTSSTSNKFNKFDENETNEWRNTYTYSVTSAGSVYYLYLVLDKTTDLTSWDDYLEDEGVTDFTDSQYYKDNLADLLDDALSTTYTNLAVSKLRADNGLLIYDETLEASYETSYTDSGYESTKRSSSTNVASYEKDGNKVEITVDDLFSKLEKKYGTLTSLDTYQYKWVFLGMKNADGELINHYVDFNAYKNDGKDLKDCIKDNDDAADFYEEVLTYVENTKNNFSGGAYKDYGYSASYGWGNFLKDYFKSNYGVQVNNVDDLKLFYIYQHIIADYTEELCALNETTYENNYLPYFAQQLNEYINTTGTHLLISVNDSDDSPINPVNWSAAQVAGAKELYDAVLQLLEKVPTSKVSTVLTELVNAFNASPVEIVDPEDGNTTPNASYTEDSIDGLETYTYNVLDYNYVYKFNGKEISINVAKYKSLGLTLTNEDLTTTDGKMVEDFENAVRNIWTSQLASITEGKSVNDTVIYDHSLSGADEYLVTEFGYHVYVNLTSSMSTYFATDSNDDYTFIAFPSLISMQIYQYETDHSSDTGYVTFSDLYKDYTNAEDELVDATDDTVAALEATLADAKDEIVTRISDMGLDMTFDTFMLALTEYNDNSKYVQSQITNWYSDIYTEYSGSTYYQLMLLRQVAENVDKFSYTNGNSLTELQEAIDYYVSSYESSLTYINSDYDKATLLLTAMTRLNGDSYASDAYTANLFPGEAAIASEAGVKPINALALAYDELSEQATSLYNSLKNSSDLTTEEVADLTELATLAGVIE